MQDSSIKSIIAMQSYGAIKIKLKELLDKRGITRNQLARMTNTRFEVVDKWYSGKIERVDIDILARFCFALDCNVDALLTYDLKNE